MGIVCRDGIILGTEKIVINKMMVSGTDKRAYAISRDIGCVSKPSLSKFNDLWFVRLQVVNGIVPDGRSLMYRGREEAKQYHDNFGIKIPGQVLAERLANVCQMNTVYTSQRPYGSSMILACHGLLMGWRILMIFSSLLCIQSHDYFTSISHVEDIGPLRQ